MPKYTFFIIEYDKKKKYSEKEGMKNEKCR
jgi:hypothetical protein